MDRNNNNKRKNPEEVFDSRLPLAPPPLRHASTANTRRHSIGHGSSGSGAAPRVPRSLQQQRRPAAAIHEERAEEGAATDAIDEDAWDEVYQSYIQAVAMRQALKKAAARGRADAEAQLGTLQQAADSGAAAVSGVAGRCESVLILQESQRCVDMMKEVMLPALEAQTDPKQCEALESLAANVTRLSNALPTRRVRPVERDLDNMCDQFATLNHVDAEEVSLAASTLNAIVETKSGMAREHEDLERRRSEAVNAVVVIK